MSSDNPYAVGDRTVEYKNFKLSREPEFLLWFVERCPNGSDIPMELGGKFTSLDLAKEHIDRISKTVTNGKKKTN